MGIKQRLFYSPAMHPFLIKRYAEKTALWAAMGLLNAPLAFIPALYASYTEYRYSKISPETALRGTVRYGGFKRLDSSAALAITATEMGRQVGVTFTHLYKTNDIDFENIMILQDKRSEAALLFQGDPLQDSELVASGQQHEFLRGIITHELGHTKTRGTNHFIHNATLTGRLYGLGAGLAMCGGAVTMFLGSFAAAAGLAGAAMLSMAAALSALMLRSRNSKNDEYLADIHGAQIFGADPVIIVHDFVEKVLESAIDALKDSDPDHSSSGRIVRLCEKYLYDTHPSSHDRAQTLRMIFNSSASFHLREAPHAQTHHAVRPERLQATRIDPK